MKNVLQFDVLSGGRSSATRTFEAKKVCHGRNCGRDVVGTRASLDAQRELGYAVHGNPDVCRKSRYLLTNENEIEVQGPQTSGEVEYAAIMDRGEILISVGSDHNDRSMESMWTQSLGKVFDSAKLKQMCPAVIAKTAWRYDDVRDHWDELTLRSFVTVPSGTIPYQDFKLSRNPARSVPVPNLARRRDLPLRISF
jgi:uncharacterized protein DUF2848